MAIIGSLPYPLTNGALINADTLMADFLWIISQVNANALPGGSALAASIEWTEYTASVVVFSTSTSFIVLGDQSSTFVIGRRVKSINTGGTVYSTVVAVNVATDTTVTVTNQSGVLDSGLSQVFFSTIGPEQPGLPVYTNFATEKVGSSVVLAASASTTLMITATAYGDWLDEWTPLTARFTPKAVGDYLIRVDGEFLADATNITTDSQFAMSLHVNGVSTYSMGFFTWPYGTGVQDNKIPFTGVAVATTAVLGDYITAAVSAPAISGGNLFFTATLSARRIL